MKLGHNFVDDLGKGTEEAVLRARAEGFPVHIRPLIRKAILEYRKRYLFWQMTLKERVPIEPVFLKRGDFIVVARGEGTRVDVYQIGKKL
jgi:hypothetical protein